MTKYIVFRKHTKDSEKNSWEEYGESEASTGATAIKKVLGSQPENGDYAAVPARSWRPVKVQVEQALRFS